MKTTEIICKYQTAIKLKELGIIQNSIFSYQKYYNKLFLMINEQIIEDVSQYIDTNNECVINYSAYTASELMKLNSLFKSFSRRERNNYFDAYFTIGYSLEIDDAFTKHLHENLAEGLAIILIHCIENNLLTVEDINKRLK